MTTLLHTLLLIAVLQATLVVGDYDCTCNYKVEIGVFSQPNDQGTPLGYMYEFDCKPIYGPLRNGYSQIAFEHQVAYVKVDDEVSTQMCQGDIPDADKITTKAAPTTTTTTTTTPAPTTTPTTPKPTTTTTTPKPTTTTTTTTTPQPTTTTTTTTPKPTTTTTTTTTPKPTTTTTTTTTPKPTTTTTTTTPKPTTTTTTTTPKPTTTTTTTTTTPAPTTASISEGHTDLCPLFARNDIEKNHGNIQQYGDYCYEFVPYTTQWKNAETHCNIVSGGHLVSIMSQQEQEYVLRFLTRYKHVDPVWIGLSDGDAEGVFRWSSGEPVMYKHFDRTFNFHSSRDHTLNDCIVLQTNGEWVDIPCGVPLLAGLGFGEAHSFVCKYNLTSKPQSVLNGALGTLIG